MSVTVQAPSKLIDWSKILNSLKTHLDEKGIIKYLRKNHVPFTWFYGENDRPDEAVQLVGNMLFDESAKQFEKYKNIRSEFQIVIDALNEIDINHICFKSGGIPPSFPWESNNLDILYHVEHEEKIREKLLELGYFELRHVLEKEKYLFRKFVEGESVCAVHVHTNVGWEGVPFVNLETLWQKKQQASDDPRINIPGPEDALLINIAHAQYENREIRFADFLKIYYLAQKYSLDWNYILSTSTERGWKKGLFFFLQVLNEYAIGSFQKPILPKTELFAKNGSMKDYAAKENFPITDFPLQFPFKENLVYWYSKIAKDKTITTGEKVGQAAHSSLRTIKRKIIRYKRIQPSYRVGLCGADGSGKTTHSELLDKAMSISEISTENVWIRGNLLKSVDWVRSVSNSLGLFKNGAGEKEPKAQADQQIRRGILSNPIIGPVYKIMIFLELLVKFNLKFIFPALRRRFVITDRTIYDAIIDMGVRFEDPKILDRFFAKLLIFCTPRYDKLFILQVDLEQVLARKDDEDDRDKLLARLELYNQLPDKIHAITLSTSPPIKTIHQNILQNCWHDYFARYRGLLYTIVNPN